jgi:hypothetical protein
VRKSHVLAALTAACLTLGVLVVPSAAVDGQLQTTWGVAGVRALPWSFGPVRATTDIAATATGQLILVGSDDAGIGCVTRLTTGGVLDAAFGPSADPTGSLCDLDNGALGALRAVQATSTGGLVTAAVTAGNRFVARIDAAGGVEWVNELPGNFTATGGRVLDVAPLSDGRTALLETRESGGAGWVTVIEESGSLVGVWEVPSPDASHSFRPQQILPGPRGTVLLVGELDGDGGPITAALRALADGRRDSTFASDGFSGGPASMPGHPGRGAPGPSGELVLAASSDAGVAVRRLTASGSVDPSFRTTGISAALPLGTESIGDVIVRPDGRTFLVFQGVPGSTAIHVARLTRTGALDPTFSGDGYTSLTAGDVAVAESTAAAPAPGGDLFVLGRDTAGADEPAVVLVDGTNDTAPPVARMTRPAGRWTVSPAVPLVWAATDVSPIASYDVRTRTTSYRGTFASPAVLLAGTATGARTVTVAGGTTLCASVRARDVWGHQSPWGPESCTARPLTVSQLAKSRGFARTTARGTYTGHVLTTKRKGATITRTKAKALRVALVVTTCPSCGKVRVTLGSRRLATLSLRSRTTRTTVVLPVATFAKVRTGTIRVTVVSTGKRVRIEGLGLSRV